MKMRLSSRSQSPLEQPIWIIIVIGASAVIVSPKTGATLDGASPLSSSSFTTQRASLVATNANHTVNNGPIAVPEAQVARDEFNIAQDRLVLLLGQPNSQQLDSTQAKSTKHLESLESLLLGISLRDCCPNWSSLIQDQDIQEELRLLHKVPLKGKIQLKPGDLLNELRQTFVNITELSIDGQQGDWEGEKYYKFYDSVQYYLRLLKLANNYLEDPFARPNNTVTAGSNNKKAVASVPTLISEQDRVFRRQLKTIAFKLGRDPLASSFIDELLNISITTNSIENEIVDTNATVVYSDAVQINPNFEYYEDFLSSTQFGHYYAGNISLIRESVLVFDQVYKHLNNINLQSNFTRPSKKYAIIRKMAFQVYQIRDRLMKQVSFKILKNRQDVKRIFDKLESITASKPYIRLLGDQFSPDPSGFATNVGQLTSLLDQYLANNMTQVTFYDRLSELPEDFTILGSTLALDYETKEVPKLTRFDSSYYNWHNQVSSRALNSHKSANNSDVSGASVGEARNSNLSILSKFFL